MYNKKALKLFTTAILIIVIYYFIGISINLLRNDPAVSGNYSVPGYHRVTVEDMIISMQNYHKEKLVESQLNKIESKCKVNNMDFKLIKDIILISTDYFSNEKFEYYNYVNIPAKVTGFAMFRDETTGLNASFEYLTELFSLYSENEIKEMYNIG